MTTSPPTAVTVAALCDPPALTTVTCPACTCECDERRLRDGCCPSCGCEVFGGDGREDRRKRERFAEDKRR